MADIVVVGSSGHAKVIIDIVECEAAHRIVGLVDGYRARGEETLGYEVLGTEKDLPRLIDEHRIAGGIIAIGDNYVRHQVAETIQGLVPGFEFVRAIHPSACIAKSVTIGAGTVVMAGANINPSSAVGRFCILNTNCSLDHDSVLGDYASLAPGSTTGGNVKIGEFSAVGIGATLIHGIEIGEHTIVGAGATVLQAIPSHKIAYGTPAKPLRDRKPGDKYL